MSSGSLTLAPQEENTLIAVAKGPNGETLHDRSIAWGTSDASVATVNSGGRVTALGYGTATISASAEGKSASSLVLVTATQPVHLAGNWRMHAFDNKVVPAAYVILDDEPMPDGRVVDVVIRLDSAKMTMRDDGVYSGRRYCFTETHDAVPVLRYCWGDHGRFRLGPAPASVSLASEYIQNLSAFGSVTAAGNLALVEELWISEAPRATEWRRALP